MKKNIPINMSNDTQSESEKSIHVFQKISFEKSKKILNDHNLNLTDTEIKEVMEFIHKLAELTIKEFILK
ncbi:hypothetical protein [Chryseobacterium sp. RR2-3-20]|uniref:hypothetical protein n=1 Tax=Chryseobacterium sp. RR2-3-20 TaxID=2787626 RepID=UPI001ADF9E4A|nr:hypothetical protein [Chryseobacterium sp. RR2-3-20]